MSAHPRRPDGGPEPADVIAAAVRAVQGVHDLHAGVVGEVATYLPGRRVNGVRMRDLGCAVHVVLEWGAPVGATTEAVRAAVQTHVSGPVDVTVEDIADPTVPPPAATADGSTK